MITTHDLIAVIVSIIAGIGFLVFTLQGVVARNWMYKNLCIVIAFCYSVTGVMGLIEDDARLAGIGITITVITGIASLFLKNEKVRPFV